MKKYTIRFEVNQDSNSSFKSIPIIEPISSNDGIGDFIGIYAECNCLEFDKFIDIEDEEIRAFIKDNFKDFRAVLGFMRKILKA